MAINFKEHWAYQQIKEVGWPMKITKKRVVVYFDKAKKDVYAEFELKHWVDKELGIDSWAVYLQGEFLEEYFDFPSDCWERAVANALYYFATRF